MNSQLNHYEEKVFSKWLAIAEEKTKVGLEKPLLARRKKNGTLKVNFSRTAMAILTEVQYLKKFFPSRKIPKSVAETFKRFHEFRNYINMLDIIVDLYNYLKTNTADVDRNLIKGDLLNLDKKLTVAESSINWNSSNILECIQEILDTVSSINNRVRQTQDNVIEIFKEISKFQDKPLYKRINVR